jgi:hypothetical protein
LSEFDKWASRNWKDYSFTKWKKDFGIRLVGKYDGGSWHNNRMVLIYHFSERKPTVEDFALFLKVFGKFYDQYRRQYDIDGGYFVTYQEYDRTAFRLLLSRVDQELKDLVHIKKLGGEIEAVLYEQPSKRETSVKRKVFIVHGRDKAPAFMLS